MEGGQIENYFVLIIVTIDWAENRKIILWGNSFVVLEWGCEKKMSESQLGSLHGFGSFDR